MKDQILVENSKFSFWKEILFFNVEVKYYNFKINYFGKLILF